MHRRWLYIVVLATLLGLQATSATAQGLPKIDFFVYIDNSKTIFTGKTDSPNKSIIKMLKALFSQEITDGTKRPLAGPGDKIFLHSFGDKTEPYGNPIDGGDVQAWETMLDRFANANYEVKTTEFDKLFQAIAANPAIAANSSTIRQKVVLIASDFVHDPKNNTDYLCSVANAADRGAPSPVAGEIEKLGKIIRAAQGGNQQDIYVGVLDIKPEFVGESRLYNECFQRVQRAGQIVKELAGDKVLKADPLRYADLNKNLSAFTQGLAEKIQRAAMPALTFQDGRGRAVEDGFQVVVRLKNQTAVPNRVRGLMVYSSLDGAMVDRWDFAPPRIIERLADDTIDIRFTGSTATRMAQAREVYVSIEDEERKFAGVEPRRFQLSKEETTPLVITEAKQLPERPGTIAITLVNRDGGPKTPTRLFFYEGDRSATAKESIILPTQEALGPGQDRRLEVAIPGSLQNSVSSQSPPLVSIGSGVDGAIPSTPRSVELVKPGRLKFGEHEWSQLAKGEWTLSVLAQNPSDQFITAHTLQFLDTSSRPIRECSLSSPMGLRVEAKTSIRVFCVQQEEGSKLFDLLEFQIVAWDQAKRVVSEISPKFPTPARTPLSLESGKIQQSNRSSIELQISNTGSIYNRLKFVELQNSGSQNWHKVGINDFMIAAGDKKTVNIDYSPQLEQYGVRLDKDIEVRLIDLSEAYTLPTAQNIKISRIKMFPLYIRNAAWYEQEAALFIEVQDDNIPPLRPSQVTLSSTDRNGATNTTIEPVSEISPDQAPPAMAANGKKLFRVPLPREKQQQDKVAKVLLGKGLTACISEVQSTSNAASSETQSCTRETSLKIPDPPRNKIMIDERPGQDMAFSRNERKLFFKLRNDGLYINEAREVYVHPAPGRDGAGEWLSLPGSVVLAPREEKLAEVKIVSDSLWDRLISADGAILASTAADPNGRPNISPAASDQKLIRLAEYESSIKGSWIQIVPGSQRKRYAVRIDLRVDRRVPADGQPLKVELTFTNRMGSDVSPDFDSDHLDNTDVANPLSLGSGYRIMLPLKFNGRYAEINNKAFYFEIRNDNEMPHKVVAKIFAEGSGQWVEMVNNRKDFLLEPGPIEEGYLNSIVKILPFLLIFSVLSCGYTIFLHIKGRNSILLFERIAPHYKKINHWVQVVLESAPSALGIGLAAGPMIKAMNYMYNIWILIMICLSTSTFFMVYRKRIDKYRETSLNCISGNAFTEIVYFTKNYNIYNWVFAIGSSFFVMITLGMLAMPVTAMYFPGKWQIIDTIYKSIIYYLPLTIE